ncbi:VOC family protein [Lactobacillus sp. CRM56-3]|uniref:VOC family protein n=1 Tax=Secundilactobacillus folii TaxID=2678357 RepID=A0A7X2XXE4_9LACO|nr:VOC family protein [Secundilactobacillus folii]MTV82101.1 VOC family protein [Secundilactobacillus folii]
MNIKDIDSLTLTVSDIQHSIRFYHEVFDLPIIKNATRPSVQLGHRRLEFQTTDDHSEISAKTIVPGSAELAFETHDPLENTLSHLTNYAVEIDDGPIDYQGAKGPATALWVRDPDHNLIKIVTY